MPRFVLFLCFCALFFSACAHKVIPSSEVKDLRTLPQDSTFYLPKVTNAPNAALDSIMSAPLSHGATYALKRDYLKKYFSPWQQTPNANASEVFWIKPALLKTPGFGEHLQPNSKDYTQSILDSMQLDIYPSRSVKAIITTTAAVRAVPTNKPMFNKADGYPFDRWQNSLIFAGTPVLITHESKDKAWLHIQSGFVYGWVEAAHIAALSKEQVKSIESTSHYVTPIIDEISLKDTQGRFIMQARIGQIFALSPKQDNANNYALIIYARLPNGSAKQEIIYAPKAAFKPFPLALDNKAIAQSINAMLGQRYGWGGYLANRDCSAFVRDIFGQFGIHLPRNSKAQVFYGNNSISLSALNRAQKEAYIITHATPYQTILWQNGHIMLYLGSQNGRAIIAHSVWSVVSGKRYENLLGGVVITSLHVGEEHNSIFGSSQLLIDKIEAMSDLSKLAMRISSNLDNAQNKIKETK